MIQGPWCRLWNLGLKLGFELESRIPVRQIIVWTIRGYQRDGNDFLLDGPTLRIFIQIVGVAQRPFFSLESNLGSLVPTLESRVETRV